MDYDFTSLTARPDSMKWHWLHERHPDIDAEAIPLTAADMEWKMAPEIIDGLKDYLDHTLLGYPVAQPAYFAALEGWMERRHGFAVARDWIVPVSGVVPALYTVINALTRPSDGIIVMPPVYFPFYRAIADTERRQIDCPLLNERERYTVDFDAFETLASDPATTMFILCSPHNPGGLVWPADTLRRIDAICRKHGVLVVSDEIHHDLILPGYRHTVFQTLSPETAQNTITCTAPSKTFNLAGMGIANLIVANEAHRAKILAMHEKTGQAAVTLLAYKACELAYSKGDAWLDQVIGRIEANRRLAEAFLAEHFPAAVTAPLQGTYLLWVNIRDVSRTDGSLERLRRLIALPGGMFGPQGDDYIRLNLALPAAALERQLRRTL